MKNFLLNLFKATLVVLPVLGAVVSCRPDEPNPLKPAEANITIQVKSRATGADITSSSAIEVVSSTSTSAVSGNVITLTGSPDIPFQTLKVKASANDKSAIADVIVGGVAVANVSQVSAIIVIDDTVKPDDPGPGPGPGPDDPGQEAKPAKATLTVTVIDVHTSKDVTAASDLVASTNINGGDIKKEGNKFIITGNKDILAQTITVQANYGSVSGISEYKLPAVYANNVYEGTLCVYVTTYTGGGEQPKDPAKAVITITVKDRSAAYADVTKDSKISAVSSVADADVKVVDNVITITGAKAIAAQTLTITAEHKSGTAVQTFSLAALAEGELYKAGLTLYVGTEPGPTPGDPTITYYEEFVVDHNEFSSPYFLTNATAIHASVTSDIGAMRKWMYNDTEYYFESKETYPYFVGSYVKDFNSITDENVIKCARLYNGGIEKKTAVYNLRASAWSMFTLYVVVETKTSEYKVVKKTVTSDGNVTLEDYDKFYVISKPSVLYYEEQAIAGGHGSHYSHGHGHGTHGGGENAGGGIIIAD